MPLSRALRRAGTLVGLASALLLAPGQQASAQDAPVADSSAAPKAAAADVASMDAILHALYDVISGPAGPRDWQRFRSLFAPGARLIPTRRGPDGHPHVQALTPDDYVRLAAPRMTQSPFYEHEIGRTAESFGAVTQVFSAYASRHAPSDATPFARGINSIQLFDDGTRWYVVTIYWDAERPGLTIPDRYLNSSPGSGSR